MGTSDRFCSPRRIYDRGGTCVLTEKGGRCVAMLDQELSVEQFGEPNGVRFAASVGYLRRWPENA